MLKKSNPIEWVHISNPTEENLNKLQKKYGFHDIDIHDCVSITHRSKIAYYDDYIFAIFLYPIYHKDTREITAKEFDFWIGKNYLISAYSGTTDPLSETFNEFQQKTQADKKLSQLPPEKLLYEINLNFANYCMPMIKHIDEDLDYIEKMIFSGHEKKMVREISIMRRNITDYRKIMEPYKNLLEKLKYHFQFNKNYAMKKNDLYFDNLIDYAKEIWNTLENFKERIEALQQTNENLITFKINDMMGLLTVISFVSFPATLIATIFGANTINPPITDFWILISLMSAIVFLLLVIWIIHEKRIMK